MFSVVVLTFIHQIFIYFFNTSQDFKTSDVRRDNILPGLKIEQKLTYFSPNLNSTPDIWYLRNNNYFCLHECQLPQNTALHAAKKTYIICKRLDEQHFVRQ